MAVRNRERGEKARLEIIEETGNKATDLMMCDVSSTDSIRLFANEFKDRYERLDVLINNAGIHKRAPLEDMSLEDGRIVCDIKI